MAARAGSVLPSRGVDRPPRFVRRGSAFHQISLGTAVVLSGALVIALVLVVPRPDIILTDAQYFPQACDKVNATRVVIATFLLTNHGGSSGGIEVDLFADGNMLTSGIVFEVPAQATVRGTLSGILHDCAAHTYSLHTFYPADSG